MVQLKKYIVRISLSAVLGITFFVAGQYVEAATQADCAKQGAFVAMNGVCIPSETGLPDPPTGTLAVAQNVANWLFMVFGFLGIVAFVISGIQYLTAGGDETQVEKAKKNMLYSILGVIVGLSGVIVVRAVETALEAQRIF